MQQVLSSIVPAGEPAKPSEQLPQQALLHCERFVELLVDLLSQLPTHRFVRALLEDRAILVKCQLSGLHSHPSGEPRPEARLLGRCLCRCCRPCGFMHAYDSHGGLQHPAYP